MPIRAHLITAFCCLLASACSPIGTGGRDSGITAADGRANDATWGSYLRDEDYPNIVSSTGTIVMRDGVELFYSVALPATADGVAVNGPFPTILTQTGYNIDFPIIPASNEYLIKRGYAHVSLDVRGTGNSGGTWDAFGENEQADYGEVMDWVSRQPFCDGNVGTWGASFMAITQLFTAAHQHPAHKAMFTIVPMADAYRDIVFTGGETNVGFIPLWMGLVTGLTLAPTPSTFDNPAGIVPNLATDLINAAAQFQVPIIVDAATGAGPTSYDGPFWRLRSTIEYTPRIKIPTFIVGGLNDIFQRGEPLLYEALKKQTLAKLLIGPWTHITSGDGLPQDGVPSLDAIAVQWFDQHLRGIDTGAKKIPNVTQYVYGAEKYSTATDWPHPQARAERWFLRENGGLSREQPGPNESSTVVLQLPINGLCSTSTNQWTAGLASTIPLDCFFENTLNEATLESTFTSAPMTEDYYINGPIQADIWISPEMALDVGVSVKITLVGADGISHEITNGLLSARHRALDFSRSRYLNGQMIQPWHPFTAEAESAAPAAGEPVLLNVEVFPTSLMIPAGAQLRVAIGASDFPHGLPPLVDLADQIVGVYSVLSDAEHSSSVVFPVVPASAAR